MAYSYQDILAKIRQAFPSPVVDKASSDHFARNVSQAIYEADALKGEGLVLGKYAPLDYEKAQKAAFADTGIGMEEVNRILASYCEGSIIPGHPRTQRNVISPPTMSSLIGSLVASMHNPNLCWDEHSHRLALAEVEVAAMAARLIGYDASSSGGVFTFGGTATNIYALKVGLEKAIPNAIYDGVNEEAVVIGSEASHYCRYTAAGWLGLGYRNVITVPTDTRDSIRTDLLRERLRDSLQLGIKVAGIVATMGTTDTFGIDNLPEIVAIRDELCAEFDLPYRIHVHADAVIGWAWAVFNDYDFNANPLEFHPRTLHMLATAQRDVSNLHLADSVGIDFHKSGFTPYISSMVLFKNREDLKMLLRPQEQMPYLYQFGGYRPGVYTIESSRPGGGILAALANIKLFGKQGFQVIIGHLVEMTRLTREHLEERGGVVILNHDNVGPVTIFRVYPDSSLDARQMQEIESKDIANRQKLLSNNDYNRRLYHYLRDEALVGNGVMLSFTDCYRLTDYGEPVLGLKSFIMSPFLEEDTVKVVVDKIFAARKTLAAK